MPHLRFSPVIDLLEAAAKSRGDGNGTAAWSDDRRARASASCSCCRAAARSAPTRPAPTRPWPKPAIEPDWVAGISIGAINAAIDRRQPAGATRRAAARLLGTRISRCPRPPARTAAESRPSVQLSLQLRPHCRRSGVPGFFEPRFPPPLGHAGESPRRSSFYDTTPLRRPWSDWSTSTCSTTGRCGSASARSTSRTGNFAYFDSATSASRPSTSWPRGALPPASRPS